MRTLSFAIRGPIARSDLAGLSARVCGLLEQSRPQVALCDVSGVAAAAVTVDALARLELAARRHDCRMVLCEVSDELRQLVELMGLENVLLGVEVRRQPE